jgi:hypothetical protein
METDILLRIIALDITKIRQYLRELQSEKAAFEPVLRTVESPTPASRIDISASQHFLEWYKNIFVIRDLPSDAEPKILVNHVRWAREAKWNYLGFLKAVLAPQNQQLPRWVYAIFKLGRYSIASKALAQLAVEFPALFNPMIVEAVPAPPNTRFAMPKEASPLTCVLRRVAGGREKEYISRLSRIWNALDPEACFRGACSLNLVVHAEMQLVSFYDHNVQCTPSFRFIGVSKKSCYLCRMFLTTHPESFNISSCHQKLYLAWIPPPADDPTVYKRYKSMTTELAKVMEATAKQELESRLGSARRSFQADSTAGVSLTGLTETRLAVIDSGISIQSQSEVAVSRGPVIEMDHTAEGNRAASESSSQPIEVVELTSFSNELESIPSNTPFTANLSEQFPRNDQNMMSDMVFHVMRSDDLSKQDIISIGDIIDSFTGRPSWAKLVKFLKADDGFGIAFQEGHDCLIINNRICVINERQFLACLQYLRNSGALNVEAFVHELDAP